MASRELRFDVSALDQASKVFVKMASAVDRFEKRLDKLDGKSVDAQVDVDTKRADDKIGRFATDLRRKVTAAVDALPDIDITADSSDADRKLADLRRRMEELADKRIGVDLSADEAMAEARALRGELEDLGRTSPNVQVQADTAAAIASLQAVDTAVDRLDGRTARVNVDTGNAVIQVAALGRALSQLALPAGLIAAAPPILALGQAAVTASGALWMVPAAASAAGLAVGTLKVAFSGFGDAIGDDPEKAAEAMAKMAPAAREAATAVQGLRPAWDALRLDVQGQMFEGLGQKISSLGGRYLPILRDSMSRVAESFNYGATQVAGFLEETRTVDTVRTMFSDLENTVENLTADTMKPLAAAFVDVGSVGASVLRDISAGAGAAAEGFATFVSQARASGDLERWMRGGVDALADLGRIAINVGASIGAVFRAAGVSTGDFLGNLVDLTGRMREFLSSAEGQQQMITIFEGINRVVTALMPGIAALGRALGQMAQNQATVGALEAIAAALSRLIEAAAPVIVAFSGLASQALLPLAAAAGAVAPVLGPLIAALLSLRAAAAGVRFLGMITGLTALRGAATGVAGYLRGAGTAAAGAGAAAAASGRQAQAAGGRFRSLGAALGGLAGGPGLAAGVALYAIGAAANSGRASIVDMNAAVEAGGPALDAMRQRVAEQSTVVGDGLIPAVDRAAASFDDWFNSTFFGTATTADLNAALAEQQAKIGEAAAAAGLSVGTYQAMTGAMESSGRASKVVTDNLARIGPAMAGIRNGVIPTQEMQTALDATAGSARTAANDAGIAAAQLGGVGAGADAAAASMQASRDAFIQTATSAGMTGQEAAALADKLGLIPATARTQFETNAATTALEVQQVADKLRAVPPGHTITMAAMTAPAQAALSALGVTVRTMPDGTVEVTANTAQAQANMQAFINGTRDQRADITINGQTQPAATALQNVLALVAAGRGTINIDGNDQPARGVLAHVLGMVQGSNATININGNQVPAEQVVNSLIAAIDSKSSTVDINGNRVPIDQVLASLSATTGTPIVKDIRGNTVPLMNSHGTAVGAITTPSTKPIDGNPTGGLDANSLLVGAVEAPGTKPVGANTAAGMGAVAGLQGSAEAGATKPVGANTGAGTSAVAGLQGQAEAGATKPVSADTGGARGVVNSFISWVSGLVATVSVVANKIGFAEGGIMPMASGGVVPMASGGGPAMPKTWDGNRLNPMTPTAQIVRPQTWRVVGDRPSGDEAYIPLVPSSGRSKAILTVAAQRMGFDLVPAGSITSAASLRGPTLAAPQLNDVRARVQAAVTARASTTQISVSIGRELAELSSTLRAEMAELRSDVLFAGASPDVVTALNRVREVLAAVREPGVDVAAVAARHRAAFGLFGGGSAR